MSGKGEKGEKAEKSQKLRTKGKSSSPLPTPAVSVSESSGAYTDSCNEASATSSSGHSRGKESAREDSPRSPSPRHGSKKKKNSSSHIVAPALPLANAEQAGAAASPRSGSSPHSQSGATGSPTGSSHALLSGPPTFAVTASARFEGPLERSNVMSSHRDKLYSRSSSAGPSASNFANLPQYNPTGPNNSGNGTEEADFLALLLKDFSNQLSTPLNNLIRRNKELRQEVSMLLKASHTEEAPFIALVREKESQAREYDQLRYEHQMLQQEFQSIRRENLDLLATVQQLRIELEASKANNSNASHADRVSAYSSHSQPASSSMYSSTSSSVSDSAINQAEAGDGSQSNSSLSNSSHLQLSASNQLTAHEGQVTTWNVAAISATAPEGSPRTGSEFLLGPDAPSLAATLGTTTPTHSIRRKDNVAELEQSILELEEEIRSPRALTSASPSLYSISSDPGKSTSHSDSEKATPTKESKGNKESSATPSSGSGSSSKGKRKVIKSHSNDAPNTHSINSSSGDKESGSNLSTPNSGRAKAPPERNISAPSSHSKTSAIVSSTNTSEPSSTSGSPKPSRPLSNPSFPSNATTGNNNGANTGSPLATPASSTSSSNSSGPLPPKTPEDREEQRLAKYMGGGYGLSAMRRNQSKPLSSSSLTTNATSSTRHSGGPSTSTATLSNTEQNAFVMLFKKWDSNDDGFIERAELECLIETMNQYDILKELHASTAHHISTVPWDSLGLNRSALVSLSSSLAFVSDCKSGHPNPSVFAVK